MTGMRRAKRRILIIDDHADVGDTMAALLRHAGTEVQVARCGVDGLSMGAEFQPHVILLDLRMPEMDGYEVARRLRQEPWGQRATLIAVSAFAHKEALARVAGFDGTLTKPITPEGLAALLGNVMPVLAD